MLSHGRPCLRRHLCASLDSFVAGPDEPLLFLYPRWAASALQRRRPMSSLKYSSASRRCCSFLASPCRSVVPQSALPLSPFRRQTCRWIASNATTTTEADNDSTSELPCFDGERGQTHEEENKKDESAEAILENQPAWKRRESKPATAKPTRINGIATKNAREGSAQPSALRSLTPGSRIRVPKPFLQRTLSPRNRRQLRYGEFLLAKEKQETSTHKHPGNWFEVRDLLLYVQRRTRAVNKRGPRYKELYVPEETIALMSGITSTSMKENIWHIHVRHGCRVHVLAPKDGDGLNRKVLLSGSERAVEVAEDNIKQSQSLQTNGDPLIEIQRPTVSVLSSRDALNRKKLPIPVIRGVWTFPKPKKEHLTLDEVIKAGPSFGTVKEFAEHIEDLVNTHRLKSIERAQDKVDVAPEEQIAKRIVQLFGGDTNQKVISTAALNSALEFLFKHEFLKPARDIFNRGVQFATADTYNILLRSAARRQDKRMFQLFLQNMSQQQIQPNADTWLALLEAMLTSKTKSYIIKDMAKKGYMKDINTVRGALQLTISDSFLVHLDGGRNVHSFFDLMMKTNGADWFSPSLLGQLFNVVSRTKNFNAMDELLDICIQNQLELNGSCLTQVLHMVEDDIHSALEYTHKFLESRQFKMDSRAFEKLFLIAFQGHNYNICRVLWHYACMEQAVTFRMRSTVLNSFVRNTSVKNGSEDISNIWQLSAGKVIVRNNLRNACQPKDFPINELSSEFWEHPFLYLLSGFKPKGPERALQLRLAKAFVDHDIQLGSNDYQPKYSLAIMLEAAVIMDREWENKPRPLTWMLQNAIEIPIRTRD